MPKSESRTPGRSKKKSGKRRAVSPALSTVSNNTIGAEFVNRVKRLKSEPGDDLQQPTPPASSELWEIPPIESPQLHDDSTIPSSPCGNVKAAQLYASVPFATEPSIPFANILSHPAKPLVSESTVQVLSRRPAVSKRFQDAIGSVIRDAFLSVPVSADDTPGLSHMHQVLEALKSANVPTGRVKEVTYHLNETWRAQMADYLGERIRSEEVLQTTITAIIGALPFKHSQGSTSSGSKSDHTVNDSSHVLPKLEVVNERHLKRSRDSMESLGEEDLRALANSRNAGTPRIQVFNEQFPAAFDVFHLYMQEQRLRTMGRRQDNPADGEDFQQRTQAFFDTMSAEQQRPWAKLHAKLVKGDSSGLGDASVEAMVVQQDLLGKVLRVTTIATASTCGTTTPKPVFIKHETRPGYNTNSSIMLIVNTPDLPKVDLTEPRLKRACRTACTPCKPTAVERWSEHIWVVKFDYGASQARGKAIVLNGVAVAAEELQVAATWRFYCDVTDLKVSNSRMAGAVAEAFAGRPAPKLFVQQTAKLREGRLFTIRVPESQAYARLYIPVRLDGKADVFMACFLPVPRGNVCLLCREVEEKGCCHSKSVFMPRL